MPPFTVFYDFDRGRRKGEEEIEACDHDEASRIFLQRRGDKARLYDIEAVAPGGLPLE